VCSSGDSACQASAKTLVLPKTKQNKNTQVFKQIITNVMDGMK
jgi:hypothetical protein